MIKVQIQDNGLFQIQITNVDAEKEKAALKALYRLSGNHGISFTHIPGIKASGSLHDSAQADVLLNFLKDQSSSITDATHLIEMVNTRLSPVVKSQMASFVNQ